MIYSQLFGRKGIPLCWEDSRERQVRESARMGRFSCLSCSLLRTPSPDPSSHGKGSKTVWSGLLEPPGSSLSRSARSPEAVTVVRLAALPPGRDCPGGDLSSVASLAPLNKHYPAPMLRGLRLKTLSFKGLFLSIPSPRPPRPCRASQSPSLRKDERGLHPSEETPPCVSILPELEVMTGFCGTTRDGQGSSGGQRMRILKIIIKTA